MATFQKGHLFRGPDGMAYRAAHDLKPGALVYPQDFEPIGGAPEPVKGEKLPTWLAKQLWPGRHD